MQFQKIKKMAVHNKELYMDMNLLIHLIGSQVRKLHRNFCEKDFILVYRRVNIQIREEYSSTLFKNEEMFSKDTM